MLLKRQYNEARQFTHVRVVHTGMSSAQRFSHRLVEEGVANGIMAIEGDTLVMRAEPDDLRYHLKRTPGYYCVSTGERIPISDIAMSRMRRTGIGDLSAREAQAWLSARGKDVRDYEVTNAYECELYEEQHEKFRAVSGPKGRIVAAYRLQGEG